MNPRSPIPNDDNGNSTNVIHVLILGRGIYALSLIRILGQDNPNRFHITLGTSVPNGSYKDIGSTSRYVDTVLQLSRPDTNLERYQEEISTYILSQIPTPTQTSRTNHKFLILPVLEEAIFVSQIQSEIVHHIQSQINSDDYFHTNVTIQFLVSPYSTLVRLHDKFQFQTCMEPLFCTKNCTTMDFINVAKTTLVTNEKEMMSSIADTFHNNPYLTTIVVKPTYTRGSIGTYTIQREQFFNANAKNPPTTTLLNNTILPSNLFLESDNHDGSTSSKITATTINEDNHNKQKLDSSSTTTTNSIPNKKTTEYIVQEYVHGKEVSTLSLCVNGIIQSHICYIPKGINMLDPMGGGFSPIKSLLFPKEEDTKESTTTTTTTPNSLYARTFLFVQQVVQKCNITHGFFGFDFIEQYNGQLVPLECNPRITNGIAFLSPRFYIRAMAGGQQEPPYYVQIQNVLLDWIHTDSTRNITHPYTTIRPRQDNCYARNIMTTLPTIGHVLSNWKEKQNNNNILIFPLIELIFHSYDDVWWIYDPVPYMVVWLRFLYCLFYAKYYLYSLQTNYNTTKTNGNSNVITPRDLIKQWISDEIIKFEPKHHQHYGHTQEPDNQKINSKGGSSNTDVVVCNTSTTVGGLYRENTDNENMNCSATNKNRKKDTNHDNHTKIKILVTGATGFLGSRLVQILHSEGDLFLHSTKNNESKEESKQQHENGGFPEAVYEMFHSIEQITATGRNITKGKQLIDSLRIKSSLPSFDQTTTKTTTSEKTSPWEIIKTTTITTITESSTSMTDCDNTTKRLKTKFIPADLSNSYETYKLIQDHDIIFHCAAACEPWGYWDDYIQCNVLSTQNLMEAFYMYLNNNNNVPSSSLPATRRRRPLLVHISSPSICFSIHQTMPRYNVNEKEPLPINDLQCNRYSVTKKIAEECILDIYQRYNHNSTIVRQQQIQHEPLVSPHCVILRPRAIFGPGDTTLFPLLVDRLKNGKLRIIENQNCVGDYTHVDNVVYACLLCCCSNDNNNNNESSSNTTKGECDNEIIPKVDSSTTGTNSNITNTTPAATATSSLEEIVKIYNITNGEPKLLWKDVIEKICNKLQLKYPSPNIIIPRAVAYKIAHCLEILATLKLLLVGGNNPKPPLLTRYVVNILSISSSLDITAAKKDLGYRPIVSFADGIDQFLEDFTKNNIDEQNSTLYDKKSK